MYEDKGVEMDPHSHENVYIYPDIVKLMDSIGLPESKVMGGTLYNQPNGINTWTNLINGQNGVIFPNKFWKPEYMMGGGTPQHTADINAYGFWNPQSMTNYLAHDPLQTLEHFGVGCDIKIKDTTTIAVAVNAVRNLINKVQSGQYPQSGFYYQTIFFGHGDLNNTTVYNKLLQMADSMAAIVATGKVQWKTMKQGYTLWETVYNKNMCQWQCGQIAGINENETGANGIVLYPNPAEDEININYAGDIRNVQLTNIQGKELGTFYPNDGKCIIDVKRLPRGLYFLKIHDANNYLTTKKIIINR
jgi:hypothetical protein